VWYLYEFPVIGSELLCDYASVASVSFLLPVFPFLCEPPFEAKGPLEKATVQGVKQPGTIHWLPLTLFSPFPFSPPLSFFSRHAPVGDTGRKAV